LGVEDVVLGKRCKDADMVHEYPRYAQNKYTKISRDEKIDSARIYPIQCPVLNLKRAKQKTNHISLGQPLISFVN
jgi:hypothetical protein